AALRAASLRAEKKPPPRRPRARRERRVARRACEPVGLPPRRTADDRYTERGLALRHPPYEEELLRVLVSEERRARACNVEQPVHDQEDAGEVTRPRGALVQV